jgi:predicted alpha/beta hydrolase family esterase
LGQSSFKRLVESLNSSIESAEGEIIMLLIALPVNQSLVKEKQTKIVGALLVAPADVDSPHTLSKPETSPIPY